MSMVETLTYGSLVLTPRVIIPVLTANVSQLSLTTLGSSLIYSVSVSLVAQCQKLL